MAEYPLYETIRIKILPIKSYHNELRIITLVGFLLQITVLFKITEAAVFPIISKSVEITVIPPSNISFTAESL